MNWAGMTYGTVQSFADHSGTGAGGSTGGAVGNTSVVSVSLPSFSPRYASWLNGQPPTQAELEQQWLSPNSESRRLQTITRRWDEPGVLQLRPDSISQTAWSGILSNLRTSVGETLGDWVRVLGENAQYLSRHGQPNANIDDLWPLAAKAKEFSSKRPLPASPIKNLI